MKHETNEGVSNNAESQITKSEGADSGIQQAALSSYDNGSFRSFVQESNQTSAAQSEKLANNNTIGNLSLTDGSASEQNLQSAQSVQDRYFDRSPWATNKDNELKGSGKTSNEPRTISNKQGPYDMTPPIPPNNWNSPAPAHDRNLPKAQDRPAPVHRPAPVSRPSW